MSLEARIAAIEAQIGVAAPLRESADLLFAKPVGAGGAADFAPARGKDPRVAGKPGGGKGLALDANGKMPRRLCMLDVYDDGTRVNALPRSILNVIGATSITDNPAEDSVDLEVGGADTNDFQSYGGGLWLDVANLGDSALSVAAGATVNIAFPQGIWDSVSMDGSNGDRVDLLVSSAFSGNNPHSAQYFISLSVLWEDANFARAAWIDMALAQQVTANGPQFADYHARTPANCFTVSNPTGLGVLWCKDTAVANPKAASVPLAVHAKATNGDVIARTIIAAYLWIYAVGYDFF